MGPGGKVRRHSHGTAGFSCRRTRPLRLSSARHTDPRPAPKGLRFRRRAFYFRGNISLLIRSIYLEVASYTPGKVLMGRPWEAQGM